MDPRVILFVEKFMQERDKNDLNVGNRISDASPLDFGLQTKSQAAKDFGWPNYSIYPTC
jgi:hypothetical protein